MKSCCQCKDNFRRWQRFLLQETSIQRYRNSLFVAGKNGRLYEESASVAVFGPDANIADEPDWILEFSELAPFLALQMPSEGACTCLLMALTETYGFPVGAVLELESNIATRFESIAQWLAAELAL